MYVSLPRTRTKDDDSSMNVTDKGHSYLVENFDGEGTQEIHFLKRVGEGYPFNEPPAHKGTNCQEVIKVLIDRVQYLNKQIACPENELIIRNLKSALWLFEKRAAERHHKDFPYSIFHPDDLYKFPTNEDGHTQIDNPIFQALIDEAQYGSEPWNWDPDADTDRKNR